MPLRPVHREQSWLIPPSLDDLIPDTHPARFVAGFVEEIDRASWAETGIDLDGEALGALAYHPRLLLSVWLNGFMTGIRSSRKLEIVCREQVPFLWLTGWQHPDHNTLWRFYQAHRHGMRHLLKYTVATAMEMGQVDLAVQAIDGIKITAHAATDRTYDAAGLQRLFDRTEAAIGDLEAQNAEGNTPVLPHLPDALHRAHDLRSQRSTPHRHA